MALTRITQGVIKPNQNYDTHDINSTGIVTATGLNISGNASIGGVLTYEDVTNVDSIGIITARSDIKVGTAVTITSAGAGFYAGIVTASKFDGRLETLPNSNKTNAYVAVKEDSGTIITTTGNVTINQSIFSVGDIISVYNNSASNISIVQGTSVTLRLAGTATTGTRTLAQRGLMTVTCVASNEFVCSGGGLS